MRKIRILFILEATIGGTYKHLLLLLRNISREDFDISVVLSPTRNATCYADAASLSDLGVHCYFVPMSRKISLIEDFSALFNVCKLLKKKKFDIIHAHSSKAGIIGRIAGLFYKTKCLIYTPHCFYFQSKHGVQRYFFKKLEQLAGYATDYIVSVSPSERRLTLNENIISEKKVVLIENSVPLAQAPNNLDCLRTQYNIDPKCKIVAGIGRITEQKDWRMFVKVASEVLKKNEDVFFVIAGSGEDEGAIAKDIYEYHIGSKVILIGHKNNIDELYSIASVILNTSLWEGLCYVILEAMVFKIPVVATNIPGNYDLIQHGRNGFLFDVGDYETAAKEVINILSDEPLSACVGERAYNLLESDYKFETFISKHESLYKGVKV